MAGANLWGARCSAHVPQFALLSSSFSTSCTSTSLDCILVKSVETSFGSGLLRKQLPRSSTSSKLSRRCSADPGFASSDWDWNRWTRYFSEIEQAESFASLLKPSNAATIDIQRRHLLASLVISLPTPFLSTPITEARGLFQMPPPRLSNRYFLVRAGESEFETMGVINTNPVAKTSMDNGLSEKGKKQTVKAAVELKAMGACDRNCWIWPSITQRAYQAAEVIAAVNGVNRSCIVPEYSFLDARGLGAYEGKSLESLSEVYASDSLSQNIKPPPINDGTPNESVADVFVRVIQLMSILETQYSEDTVIIVSPDSDNLTILQAGLLGLDLRRHMDLSFGPGEVRFVDPSSIPTYKQPASGLYKCLNPPSCN